jgi:hypothetical protein
MLEEAHGICAVALHIFEISCRASDEVLYALPSYVLIAAYRHGVFIPLGCAMRTLRLLDDARLHVKLLAILRTHRLQSPL